MNILPNNFRLGRKAVKTDTRTLKFAKYLATAPVPLPAPPAKVDWTKGQSNWGMMKNDALGCCTIAGCAHAIQVWSQALGKEITLSDDNVIAMYEKWDGYNPNDPNTDCGGIELDVLTDWRQQGFFGHGLNAFVSVNPKNLQEVKQAINLFGGVYIGVALPLSAQEQNTWDVVTNEPTLTAPGSWGGHCVYVPTYDEKTLTCITWGQTKTMTNAFWNEYVDEAYALLGTDWISATGTDPEGMTQQLLTFLMQDLGQIR